MSSSVKRCGRCFIRGSDLDKRHRSLSPLARSTCSLMFRQCMQPEPLRQSLSHHDIRDSDSDESPVVTRRRPQSNRSMRRPLYTDELFSDSLQPSKSMELRIASTNANKGHSWRGDHPMKSNPAKRETFRIPSSHCTGHRHMNNEKAKIVSGKLLDEN